MSAFRCPRGLVLVVAGLIASPPSAANAWAQQGPGTVRGTVTDTRSERPLPGIQLLFPALHVETRTDDRGRFRIENVPPGRHEIRIALIGCLLASRVVEVPAGRSVAVNLQFALEPVTLQGLVVTGAPEAAEAGLPVTINRLNVEEGRTAPSLTVAELIQGRIAGARVIQGSGQPGEAPSIQLRGPTSIQGSQDPLVVVDGVILQGTARDIDPLDIESIEVRKGAAAAALYGSRGSAGVIEITTKRGAGDVAPARVPLMIVDGVITRKSLAEIDPGDIQDMEMVRGAAVEALFGSRAEAGVIRITTRSGASVEAGDVRLIGCLDPSP